MLLQAETLTKLTLFILRILQIFAEESQTATKQQHNASVSITLTDENEFDPVFPNNSYQANISENSVVGASVIQVNLEFTLCYRQESHYLGFITSQPDKCVLCEKQSSAISLLGITCTNSKKFLYFFTDLSLGSRRTFWSNYVQYFARR